VSYGKKLICRRAGWDYAQVVAEQSLLQQSFIQKRQKEQAGYGIYFSGLAEDLVDFSDLLAEKLDAWNARVAEGEHLRRYAFEGRDVGVTLEEFVYLDRPARPVSLLTRMIEKGRLHINVAYQPAPEQARLLENFIDDLRPRAADPSLSIYVGAVQINRGLIDVAQF
jgi:hypothetical protein